MAKLDEKESKLLEKLLAKRDAPDAPSVGKTLNVSIDLGDPDQVARAQKLGLLDGFDDDDGDGDKGGDDDDGDEPPRRRGYF